MAHDQNVISLPLMIVSPIDLGRLQRELAAIDDFLLQASVRSPGQTLQMPKTTKGLEDFAQLQKLSLLKQDDRTKLVVLFKEIHELAPVIHMSFAVDPSAVFLQKIVEWFRREVHPMILVQTGLQPSIAAGCMVRTNNRYFDFSLRRHFEAQSGQLVDRLRKELTA